MLESRRDLHIVAWGKQRKLSFLALNEKADGKRKAGESRAAEPVPYNN